MISVFSTVVLLSLTLFQLSVAYVQAKKTFRQKQLFCWKRLVLRANFRTEAKKLIGCTFKATKLRVLIFCQIFSFISEVKQIIFMILHSDQFVAITLFAKTLDSSFEFCLITFSEHQLLMCHYVRYVYVDRFLFIKQEANRSKFSSLSNT